MAAATGAAASAISSVYAPQRLSLPSKSFQSHLFLKPISSEGCSLPLLRLRNQESSRRSPFTLKSSQDSASQDSASQSVEEDGPPDELGISDKDGEEPGHSSLELTLSAYKDAILIGDAKTVSDVEAIIYTVEKEKNELLGKVSALSDEISSMKDRYIRLQADFDNYRKRSEKEKLTIRSDAQGEVIESLLPMVDNFERAKQLLKLETEQEKNIDASYQGIYKQFVEIMKSLRVSAVPTVGNPFDPSIHEAIAREDSQEFEEGIVIQEFRRGFILEDRLLRPAMVKVSSGPGQGEPSSEISDSAEEPASEVDERELSEQSTG